MRRMPVPGSGAVETVVPKWGKGIRWIPLKIKSPALRRGHELSVLGEPTNQLTLSADQLATEHSSDTHKSCSEETQGSRFRHGEVRGTRVDVPDTLAELFVV